MSNRIQTDELIKLLINRDFNQLINILQKLHEEQKCCNYYQLRINHSNCDCFVFFDKVLSKKLLEITKTFSDDPTDYLLNLTKGYVFLINAKLQNTHNWINWKAAYKYLTIAIEINKFKDFPYYLRSFINDTFHSNSLNKNFEYDAMMAVSINPISRNIYQLASLINTDAYNMNDRSLYTSLYYLNNSLREDPQFLCALESIALINIHIEDYEVAIEFFKKIIKIQPLKDVYLNISKCYSKINEDKKALKYAKIALKINQHNKHKLSYFERLAQAYLQLDNYEKAKLYFSKFYGTKKNLQVSDIIGKHKREKAKKYFNDNKFDNAKIIYDELIHEGYDLKYDDLVFYLISTLKTKGAKIIIDENSVVYKKFEKIINQELTADNFIKKILKLIEKYKFKKINNLKTYYWDDRLNFGKYEGKTIEDILEFDSEYLLWCVFNLHHFSLYTSILLISTFKNNMLLESAIIQNMLKQLIIQKYHLEKPEWETNVSKYDDFNNSSYINNPFYNDSLDLDQQSLEFWDSL